MRSDFKTRSLDQGIALPLRGVTSIVSQEERIAALEPFITDEPAQIAIHEKCTLLKGELDEWPEKQPNHHYDLLCALSILWMISSTGMGGIPKVKSRSVNRSIQGYSR